MPDYPKTAAYQECFPAPDDPSLAWDLESFEGSVPVPVPHAEADGLHLDGYWLDSFDKGGASITLLDGRGLSPDDLWDLTESSVTIGIVSYPDPLVGEGNGQLRLELGSIDREGVPSGLATFVYGNASHVDQLRATIIFGGAASFPFTATRAGENHWRIRLTGTTMYWETSTDPVTTASPSWSVRGSFTESRLPLAFNQCVPEIDTNFGAAVLRYYNGCPALAARARCWEVL
jgi:hypothetical protein